MASIMLEAFQCAMCGLYRDRTQSAVCKRCGNFNDHPPRFEKLEWIAKQLDRYLNAVVCR